MMIGRKMQIERDAARKRIAELEAALKDALAALETSERNCQTLIDGAYAFEREACAQIVDNLASIFSKPYVDPEPKFNTVEAQRECHHTMIECAAAAIRARGESRECEHEWIDIRNSIIENGSACRKCWKVSPENIDIIRARGSK